MARVVGVPGEVKDQERRVSMQPDGVAELVHHGHEVVVQEGAGEGSGFGNEEYEAAGARIAGSADEVFEAADLIVKVKEPIPEEYDRFREGQELFTYLHLAANKDLTEFLMDRRVDSIAYETVELEDGSLPLLTPMSQVAGRMAVQAAAHCLESPQGGGGLLLGGVPGTPAAQVTIIGGGVVGTEAAKIAAGMRAIVKVLDTNPARLAYLGDIFGGRGRSRRPKQGSDRRVRKRVRRSNRSRPNRRRESTEDRYARNGRQHAARLGSGGCGYRSGRVHRDRPAHHALGPHLRGGGSGPLLRGQHPRRRRPHLDAGPDQRDPALPGEDREQWYRRRRYKRRGFVERSLHSGKQAGLRAGRRSPRPDSHRPRRVTQLKR